MILGSGRYSDDVPVVPFRERFRALQERGEITYVDLALRLEIKTAQTSRVKRILGITSYRQGRPLATHVRYETAVALAKALDLDPVDVGL